MGQTVKCFACGRALAEIPDGAHLLAGRVVASGEVASKDMTCLCGKRAMLRWVVPPAAPVGGDRIAARIG